MKRGLCLVMGVASVLFAVGALAQEGLTSPFGPYWLEQVSGPQYMYILSPPAKSRVGCCVAPHNNVWIDVRVNVIWVNQSLMEVKLKLGKGEKCEDVTDVVTSRRDLRIGSGCYVGTIPNNKILSVYFAKPGVYEYSVTFLGEVKPPNPAVESGFFSVF
jgi:hypothetical protein